MFLLFPVWNISCVKSQNSRTQWGLNLDQFRESSVNTEPRREVGTDCIGDEPHLWWQIHKRMGTFSITICMLGGCEGTNGRKQMCADTSWKGPCSHQWCVSSLNLAGLWLFLVLTSKQWEGEAVSCSDDHPLLQSHWEKGLCIGAVRRTRRDVEERGEMGSLGTEGKGEGWSRRMLKQME